MTSLCSQNASRRLSLLVFVVVVVVVVVAYVLVFNLTLLLVLLVCVVFFPLFLRKSVSTTLNIWKYKNSLLLNKVRSFARARALAHHKQKGKHAETLRVRVRRRVRPPLLAPVRQSSSREVLRQYKNQLHASVVDALQRRQRPHLSLGDEFISLPERGAKNVPTVEETSGEDREGFTATAVFVRKDSLSRRGELKTLARDLVHVRFVGPELRSDAKLGVLGGYRERVRDDRADDPDDGWSDV